jgi:hypothetical protein
MSDARAKITVDWKYTSRQTATVSRVNSSLEKRLMSFRIQPIRSAASIFSLIIRFKSSTVRQALTAAESIIIFNSLFSFTKTAGKSSA